GPFDAIIKAMKKLIKGQGGINVTLEDYNVEIAQGGTDAVVKVTIVFTDNKKNKVIANATSPDIIVASVNAFEKAYNLLWWKNQA
ncbi:2-isopropylmalate synthase, partial [Patescibacteria group bacterium]|nr:2-isopropylmalate synthase [Patescibacteria group bacterium]